MRKKRKPEPISPEHAQAVSGSKYSDLCQMILEQVSAAQSPSRDLEERLERAIYAMLGMEPRDALEGMLIGQLIAAHIAAMDCYGRSMVRDQTVEMWRESLNQAKKLSRTYTDLAEALNRHRGKGQQRITVERVSVHAGGQAIVGAVTPGSGDREKLAGQISEMREITHEPGTPMRSPDPERKAMPIAGGAGKTPV
jgi:hypothetical protein